jgi:C4-dicarboxylate-specific signal transduction histidine kinase
MRQIERLQASFNDLIDVLALSGMWEGIEPEQIRDSLLKDLIRRLGLEFAAARLTDNSPLSSAEVLRTPWTGDRGPAASSVPHEISMWLDARTPLIPFPAPNPLGPGRVSVVPFRFDPQGHIGTLVVASARTDFPTDTEMLVLRIAVNQAASALRSAELADAERQQPLLKDVLAAELLAMTRLHEFSTRLWATTDLPAVLEEVLTATMEIQQADFGSVKLYNQKLQAFEIAAHRGFNAEILDYFAHVDHSSAAFGRAMHAQKRVVIEDVQTHASCAPHRHIAAAAGFRAMQSTPLLSREGEMLGMISTHFKHPHRPSDRELRLADLYARPAAEMIERKRTEDERAKLVARIDRLTHAARIMSLDVLTTSIAHEINQPLGGVISNSNACIRWLNREVPDLQEARTAAEHIIRDANRANDVIRSIRAFSRRTPIDERVLDVNVVIGEVMSMLEEQLRSGRVEASLELSDSAALVTGDAIQLQQVLVNLVVNAIDALRPLTDRTRRLRIRSRRETESRVKVWVEDEGIGLGEQDADRLFDPFFTTKPDGMGLGLSISRSIIEAHGGELNAARNEGHGLTLSFSLPAHGRSS